MWYTTLTNWMIKIILLSQWTQKKHLKNITSFHDKNLKKFSIEETHLKIKVMYAKPTVNFIFNGKKLRAFLLKQTQMPTLATTIWHNTGSLSHSLSARKEIKDIQIGKGDFPGGPVAKTLGSHCRGPKYNPRSGN